MNGALVELVWRGFRGSLVRRARRLRQPRYLLAFLASVAYFGFMVLPSYLNWSRQARGAFGPGAAAGASTPAAGIGGLAGGTGRLVAMAAALVLAAALTLIWALASSKPALRLGEADLDLLLPAPLARRQLIELAVWRQQAGLLLGALVVTLLRGYGTPATRLVRLLTTWGLLALINLHIQGVNLWKARLRELAPAVARRRAGIALAAGGAWWVAVALALRAALAAPLTAATEAGKAATAAAAGAVAAADAGGGLAALGDAIRHLGASPPPLLWGLLAPFRWLATALLGSLGPGFRQPGGGAGLASGGLSGLGAPRGLADVAFLLVLVTAHYEWVVRSRARFEDAVLQRARRQADRRRRRPELAASTARARRREPFPLAPSGMPEAAIYWKNLLIPSRRPLAHRAALAALAGLAAWASGAALGAPMAYLAPVAGAGFMLMVMIPPFAGLNLRHDLRADLLQVEILRPWPVPGWRLVAAELLAPATTACSWTLAGFCLVLGAALAAGDRLGREDYLHLAMRSEPWPGLPGGSPLGAIVALGGAALLAGLPIILLSTALQNVAALMLPGWVTLGPRARAGSGLAGQRLLLLLGQSLAIAAGLVPALLLVAAALLAGSRLGLRPAAWQAPALALLAALPLLVEVGLLVRAGGALWDRLDPSQELLQPEE